MISEYRARKTDLSPALSQHASNMDRNNYEKIVDLGMDDLRRLPKRIEMDKNVH